MQPLSKRYLRVKIEGKSIVRAFFFLLNKIERALLLREYINFMSIICFVLIYIYIYMILFNEKIY